MLQILSNFMEIKPSTSITFVPNLQEIKVGEFEDSFHELFKIFLFSCEKEKYEENQVILKSKYIVNRLRNQLQTWYAR